MLYLPRKPHEKLNTEQHAAWKKMRELLKNRKEADRRYDSLPDAEDGRVISTDVARFLDTRYAKNPVPGNLRDISPGWSLAWRYAQDRFERELRQRNSRKCVRFMAGGWAAGKTHAVKHLPDKPDLTWDGTLNDVRWAASMILLAASEGWRVEIVYIYRNVELALYGAVERSREEGRMVPLNQLAGSHRKVQRSIRKLTTLYRDDPEISFVYIHNLGKKGAMASTLLIDHLELERNGALHYLTRHEQYYQRASSYLRDDDTGA